VDYTELYVVLAGGEYASLAEAQAAGAATLNYGLFLSSIVTFLIVASAVFLLVKSYNRLREQQVKAAHAEVLAHRTWDRNREKETRAWVEEGG
jgi:large conductance mechanosensitive channel